jgi:hypothetical protein
MEYLILILNRPKKPQLEKTSFFAKPRQPPLIEVYYNGLNIIIFTSEMKILNNNIINILNLDEITIKKIRIPKSNNNYLNRISINT